MRLPAVPWVRWRASSRTAWRMREAAKRDEQERQAAIARLSAKAREDGHDTRVTALRAVNEVA